MPVLLEDTFRAWIDHVPDGGPKLIVIGEVQVPTAGWHVRLTRRSPQGIDPNILILDVTSERPHDKAGEMVTTIPLRYEERPPGRQYRLVMTANGADSVTVDVGHAH
ncbi:hypothetical protein [Bradyrhizobium archetypum]|uniref:Uncharacterized protein n=1 Tax=Bradyrhizobium archetypum TaxID=2721160 RepID=A0A7Y4H1T1_9BRAD|nr:hypothetical protein [Bradyrhizobium archetypum]NOJ46068.1 hypothetical protein [Bradyrhizobium archetypum]